MQKTPKLRKRPSRFEAMCNGKVGVFSWDPKTARLTYWEKGKRTRSSLSANQLADAVNGQLQLPLTTAAPAVKEVDQLGVTA